MDKWFGNDKRDSLDEKETEGDQIDYDLKNADDTDELADTTDQEEIEDWWGVEREGHGHDSKGTSSD